MRRTASRLDRMRKLVELQRRLHRQGQWQLSKLSVAEHELVEALSAVGEASGALAQCIDEWRTHRLREYQALRCQIDRQSVALRESAIRERIAEKLCAELEIEDVRAAAEDELLDLMESQLARVQSRLRQA